MEITLNINISAPEICSAVIALANAISHNPVEAQKPTAQIVPLPAQNAPEAAPTAPVAAPAAASTINPPAAPAPVQAAPVAPAPAPVDTAPFITLEQLSRAGAALATAGRMTDLMALMQKYGVQALTQLTPDKYEAVATELRAMGAQI